MSSKHKMRVLNRLLAQLIIFASMIASAAAKVPMAKPNCRDVCGNVTIPYPFGIGDPRCYLNPWFEISCNDSIPRPFLRKFHLEVLDFWFDGVDVKQQDSNIVVVNSPIYNTCRDGSSWHSTDLRDSPFNFSTSNKFWTVGCENTLMMDQRNEVIAGCTATCSGVNPNSKGCYGINCCQTTFPPYLNFYGFTCTNHTSACTYAFLASSKWYETIFSSSDKWFETRFSSNGLAPVALRWGLHGSDNPGFKYRNDWAHTCYISQEDYLYRCRCNEYHEGNPYIVNGCRVVSECTKCNKDCGYAGGKFYCRPNITDQKISAGMVGGGVLIVILVVFCFGMHKIIKRKRKLKLKRKFFKRNGGLLLQQQLSSKEDSFDTTKIFTVRELEKATDNFNITRVLGQGGQGTVYKGMLKDGMIVAVKKSKLVDEGQVEQFINEVVILSQINHRNIVKLLGCCLETEVPLLVYEFISNGTLSQLIRNQEDDIPLSWEMRLQIASEISGALAYLHSASSIPIYHRDIKSSNILLDDKYRAKVSDFGTSRSVADKWSFRLISTRFSL